MFLSEDDERGNADLKPLIEGDSNFGYEEEYENAGLQNQILIMLRKIY